MLCANFCWRARYGPHPSFRPLFPLRVRYVCVRVRVWAGARVHVCVCMRVCLVIFWSSACLHGRLPAHVCALACLRTCVPACLRACAFACLRACVHACLCTSACLHACVCFGCFWLRACVRVYACVFVFVPFSPQTAKAVSMLLALDFPGDNSEFFAVTCRGFPPPLPCWELARAGCSWLFLSFFLFPFLFSFSPVAGPRHREVQQCCAALCALLPPLALPARVGSPPPSPRVFSSLRCACVRCTSSAWLRVFARVCVHATPPQISSK